MKRYSCTILFSLLTLAPLANLFPADPSRKPNIVHIIADDLGWKNVGFNGCDNP